MIRFAEDVQVYVSLAPIDFRKGLNGLLILVQDVFKQSPQSSYLFLFRDQSRKKLKALYWDSNGFVLMYKRLEQGRFCFPKTKEGEIILDRLQLECLLSGMNFIREKSTNIENYQVYC
jgi:transposase